MSQFTETISIFTLRAKTRAAAAALESVDDYLYDRSIDELMVEIYQLDGGVKAVSEDSGLTASEKVAIAQRLTKCYGLDRIAYIEGAEYLLANNIILQQGEYILSFKVSDDQTKYVITTNRRIHTAPIIGGNNGPGGGIYNGAYPTNTQWGAIAPNTNLVGMTYDQIIEKATIAYLAPDFTSFLLRDGSNNVQAQQIEVGSSIAAGAKIFTWSTSNAVRVKPNSIAVKNITDPLAPVTYLTGRVNDGTEPYTLAAPIFFLTPRKETIQIQGQNTNDAFFDEVFEVESFHKIFYSGSLSSIPTNSAGVRAMSGQTFSKNFSIQIPQGQTKAAFSYPASWPDIVPSSVKYVEGFNSNVGQTFVKATFNVNDAGGNPWSRKTYSVTLPTAYPADATYNVTLP